MMGLSFLVDLLRAIVIALVVVNGMYIETVDSNARGVAVVYVVTGIVGVELLGPLTTGIVLTCALLCGWIATDRFVGDAR